MEVKNGIIIDGELHEAITKETKCSECSIRKICDNMICFNYMICVSLGASGFANRGKVKVEKDEEQD